MKTERSSYGQIWFMFCYSVLFSFSYHYLTLSYFHPSLAWVVIIICCPIGSILHPLEMRSSLLCIFSFLSPSLFLCFYPSSTRLFYSVSICEFQSSHRWCVERRTGYLYSLSAFLVSSLRHTCIHSGIHNISCSCYSFLFWFLWLSLSLLVSCEWMEGWMNVWGQK